MLNLHIIDVALDSIGMTIKGNIYKSSKESMKFCKSGFHYKLYMNQDKTKKEKVLELYYQFFELLVRWEFIFVILYFLII